MQFYRNSRILVNIIRNILRNLFIPPAILPLSVQYSDAVTHTSPALLIGVILHPEELSMPLDDQLFPDYVRNSLHTEVICLCTHKLNSHHNAYSTPTHGLLLTGPCTAYGCSCLQFVTPRLQSPLPR
jgi:hypothetical protein